MLSVLPRPKKVFRRTGTFVFAPDMPIVVSGRADAAERLAAAMLSDAVADLGGPTPPVERHGKLNGLKGPTVQMLLLGRDEKLCPAIARLAGRADLGREGYALQVRPKRVLAAANSSAGLFYAAQTMIQMLDCEEKEKQQEKRARLRLAAKRGGENRSAPSVALPCCRIVDWPDFKYRGFMLDISRFRVPKMEVLADLVFRLAACKINVLQLYIEHTFRCRRHPEYSDGVSPLTAEQLAELDELCALLHVELQANQNSLGHMQHMLGLAKYAHLAERPAAEFAPFVNEKGRTLPQPWSFRLDRDEVYRVLDDIYAEHLTAVRAPLVHLGCDEAWDLGTGRSQGLVERKGKLRAFVDHVKRISRLAKRYGKQALIWEDMIRSHPEVLGMLPADIIPVFWHYDEKPEPQYERIWSGSGHRHWVAPGCCSWQSIFSQIDRAWGNIHWMTGVGRSGGAEGVLNTEWGDYGNFQTLAVSHWSVALGGELSWNSRPMTDKADFDRRFARAVFNDRSGRMGRLYRLLGRTNHVFRRLPYQGPPWLLYWAEFPTGDARLARVTDAELGRCRKLAEQGLALAEELRRDPPPGVPDSLFEELISAADQTVFACRKAALAKKVRQALAASPAARGKRGKLPAQIRIAVRKLAREWDRQKAEFKRVWLLTNEPSQIAFRLGLYDQRRRDYAKLLK